VLTCPREQTEPRNEGRKRREPLKSKRRSNEAKLGCGDGKRGGRPGSGFPEGGEGIVWGEGKKSKGKELCVCRKRKGGGNGKEMVVVAERVFV